MSLNQREIQWRDEEYAKSVVEGAQGRILSPRLLCDQPGDPSEPELKSISLM